ncbi:MAG TPA: bifunctional diaminohydroxyphosphoribosylaminopyrimidine deaminase/5-amino-6-(5-phosphoribosylamino)uracil reductase RibD [Geobacteraceae bacterium]|nr:bifunctional diaminohydroxyphosphoribosylaminopyrimidine deaminase/5-amino-6-(5-phosphoribosylamino)uracil reductase RibD [Geobacteraceae bacterium]
MNDFHHKMMRRALQLARKGIGKTSPNPAVGAVVVRDGAIAGEGWHRRAGTPHAEIHALRQAGELARGSDVYVTLEPCSHYGKTPPCADALVAAGVARVFIGMIDPNPLVSGRGVERLRRAGIGVESGLLETECLRLNEAFIKHVTTGRPMVVLKSALTLDGKTATACGDSRWVTSPLSRRLVHRLRATMDGIMVGVGTLVADDPELTVRLVKGRNPLRIVVDSELRMPLDARLLTSAGGGGVVLATVCDDAVKLAAFAATGADLLVCRQNDGRVDLVDMLERLGARGVQSILLEGGETLAGEMLRQCLIDKFLFFLAPKLVGGEGKGLFAGVGAALMNQAVPLRVERISRVGGDILLEAYPEAACLQD